MVLAAALGVSPAQLMFPDLPKGEVEVLPGLPQESHDALRWFSGEAGLLKPSPGWSDTENEEPVEMWVREQFEARRLADEVLFLLHGRLHDRGAGPEFFTRPATPQARAFLNGDIVE